MASGRSFIATAEPGSEMDWIIKAAQAGRVVAPEDPEAFTDAIRLAYLEREALNPKQIQMFKCTKFETKPLKGKLEAPSEIRNPKHQIRNKFKCSNARNPKRDFDC